MKFDFRTLQAPVPPPAPVSPAPGGTYNLGHYFPRVSSEPPSRKSYQTASRNGDPLKVSSLPCFFSPFFVKCQKRILQLRPFKTTGIFQESYRKDNSIFCMTRNLVNKPLSKPGILTLTITSGVLGLGPT